MRCGSVARIMDPPCCRTGGRAGNVGMAGSDGRFVRSVPALSVMGTAAARLESQRRHHDVSLRVAGRVLGSVPLCGCLPRGRPRRLHRACVRTHHRGSGLRCHTATGSTNLRCGVPYIPTFPYDDSDARSAGSAKVGWRCCSWTPTQVKSTIWLPSPPMGLTTHAAAQAG